MRMDLNTNMEMVGLREPFKATYKVRKGTVILKNKQTALNFNLMITIVV